MVQRLRIHLMRGKCVISMPKHETIFDIPMIGKGSLKNKRNEQRYG